MGLLAGGENRSGIISVVVLWLIVILTVLAVGLGRRTSVDLHFAKHAIGKLKAKAAAQGAVMYALNQIRKDAADTTTNTFDSLYQCGISLKEAQTPEDIFKHVPLGEGYFDIGFLSQAGQETESKMVCGLEDEERKININAISAQNDKVLAQLIALFGFDENTALMIAASVADWRDADSALANDTFGAEDDFYMSLAQRYHCKNMPFENLEELLLVRGMTPEIFEKIKNYLTVFPIDAAIPRVNIDTASEIVIRALGRSVSGALTNTETADADSLAQKVIAFRRGADGEDATADDRLVDMNELGLNQKEEVIFLAIQNQITKTSNYFRIHARGADEATSASSQIEAVVDRDDLSVVFWRRGR